LDFRPFLAGELRSTTCVALAFRFVPVTARLTEDEVSEAADLNSYCCRAPLKLAGCVDKLLDSSVRISPSGVSKLTVLLCDGMELVEASFAVARVLAMLVETRKFTGTKSKSKSKSKLVKVEVEVELKFEFAAKPSPLDSWPRGLEVLFLPGLATLINQNL
jgi:hypothetical protein